MISNAPNGHIVQRLLLFSHVVTKKKEWRVAAAFKILPAVLTGAGNAAKNDHHARMETLLVTLGRQYELQAQWGVDGDYSSVLDGYKRESLDAQADGRLRRWGEVARVGRLERGYRLMGNRQLRRQHLELYVVTKVPVPRKIRRETVQPLLESIDREMEIVQSSLAQAYPGGTVRRMDDEDLYLAYLRHLNPSLRHGFLDSRDRKVLVDGFAPELSIQENCWRGDAVDVLGGRDKDPVAFYLDGHYYNLFSIVRWPNHAYVGITDYLTEQSILDYSITVKVLPLPTASEIRSREKLIQRLGGESAEGSRRSVLTALRKNEKAVDDLAAGAIYPFMAGYTVLVWADNRDELSAKSVIIKRAIQSMGSAQCYQTVAKGAVRRLFFETWPGWTGGAYTYRDLYATQDYLAALLPTSATFTGRLDDCQALYDGGARNLVGVKLFEGSTPLNSLVLGMTRGGKSLFTVDLLSQSAIHLGYIVIVEEGASYGTFTRAMGCKTILISTETDLRINLFDTLGAPLTSTHLKGVVALAFAMVGASGNQQIDTHRESLLSYYINLLYQDHFETWKQENEERYVDLAREAVALTRLRNVMPKDKRTELETFSHWQELQGAADSRVEQLLAAVDDEQALSYANEAATESAVKNLVFSKFASTDFPTLSSLVELMQSGVAKDHQAKEVLEMSDLLGAWTAERENGSLFDGHTNVGLHDRVAHFELDPNNSGRMRQLAAFLIANYARQRVLTLPRGIKKLMVFEELARFVAIPGGDTVAKETYAQLGKYSCAVMAVTQNYGQFRHLPIKTTLVGNSRNFFLLPMRDQSDLDDLGDEIGLPTATREMVKRAPMPDELPPGNRYGCVHYYSTSGEAPVNGVIHNHVAPEMMYVASSSGDVHDRREDELAGIEGEEELIERILDLTHAA